MPTQYCILSLVFHDVLFYPRGVVFGHEEFGMFFESKTANVNPIVQGIFRENKSKMTERKIDILLKNV